MADEAIVSISTEIWEKRVAQYIVATGKNLQEALAEEWPLLMRKIIDFTPPFKTRGAIQAAGENFGASDYSVGRKAVSFDIYKTMRPFDPGDLKSKSMLKIVQSRDVAAFNIVAARSHGQFMAGAVAVDFSPGYHTSARNARGRVTGSAVNRVVLGSDAALLKKYVAQVQSRVGYAKSGWAAAYNLVRSPDGWMLPDWVARQGMSGGEVIDDRANADSPSITAVNGTPWAIRKDEGERIKADAYASRINAIKTKIQTYMRLARKQAELNGNDVDAAA